MRWVHGRSLVALSLTSLVLSGFVTPAVAGASGASAATRNDPGTIEVCKAPKNGMAGQPFQFTLNGGAPFTVNGGGCSGPLVAPAGNNTVVEAPVAGLEVQKIKAKHVVSKDLGTGTVVVKVKAGSTPATESLVTYTNRPLPAVGLKVCKQTPDATLYGDLFSFTENGGAAYSVPAGPVGAPNCGPVHPYPLGTNVNIAEAPTPFVQAVAITVSDNRGSNVNPAAGTVTATIGAGVTVVTYTNAVVNGPQAGYIEVCKRADSEYVSGAFDFTITAPGYSAARSVLVGQCTEPIQVPAGNVSVAEAARFPFYVSSIEAVPAGRLVTSNLANQTATVTVPKGDESTETLVTFGNSVQTGRLKICKTLALNATALAGQSFRFNVNGFLGEAHGDTIVAGAAGSTTCKFHEEAIPLGSPATITELAVENVQNTSITVAPTSRAVVIAPPSATVTIGTGVTTATFTNAALGTVEICKAAADKSTATQTFQFSVNGGAPISVHAGHCSLPIAVPAGTATVQEVDKTNFKLVGVLAVGPGGANRLLTGPTTNPASVAVPFGGVENETVVTFTNAVRTGRFKICKESPDSTLQDVPFEFLYKYVNGEGIIGHATLKPGECSAFSADIPVVDENGDPIEIGIFETQQPTVQVSNISVANGTLVSSDLEVGAARVTVNEGVTVVTYTNVRRPLGQLQICKKAADVSTATQTFQFSVNGGVPISVHAGECSAVMTVVSGPTQVEEFALANFHVASIAAFGPLADNRLTSGPTDNPATVVVKPGTAGTDVTVARFTNAVDTGQLVFCKASPDQSLQSTGFLIGGTAQIETDNLTWQAALLPGECSSPFSYLIPVVDPAGNPYPISMSESPTAGVVVTAIKVENGTLTNGNLGAGTATVYVNKGITKITYTNEVDNECRSPQTKAGSFTPAC